MKVWKAFFKEPEKCECGRVDGCHINKGFATGDFIEYWSWKGLFPIKRVRWEMNWKKARECVWFRKRMKKMSEAATRIVERQRQRNLSK